jgi:hypothetical protein
VTVEPEINLITSSGNSVVYTGGAVGGVINTATGTVTLRDSSLAAEITESRSTGNGNLYSGGAIGYVSTTNTLALNFENVTVDGLYENTGTASNLHYGGLISYICHNRGNSTRTVNLTDVTVAGLDIISKGSGSADRANGAGALLGWAWLDTNVNIGSSSAADGVTIARRGTAPTAPPSRFPAAAASATWAAWSTRPRATGLSIMLRSIWQPSAPASPGPPLVCW